MFGKSSVQLPSPKPTHISTPYPIPSLLFMLRLSRALYLVGRCRFPLRAASIFRSSHRLFKPLQKENLKNRKKENALPEPTHYPQHTFHQSTYLAHPPQPTPIIHPRPSPKPATAPRRIPPSLPSSRASPPGPSGKEGRSFKRQRASVGITKRAAVGHFSS